MSKAVKPKTVVRDVQVSVRLTEEEYRVLKAAADSLGHNVSWLIRDLASDYVVVMAAEMKGSKMPLRNLQDARRLIDEAIKAAGELPSSAPKEIVH